MLRIDDTDQERSTQEFERAILEDVNWLGLRYDLFAKQSDRFDRYRAVMSQLVEQGRIYPCYETPEELEFKRKRQLTKGEPPLYDRAALALSQSDREALEAQGRKPHWRFKMNAAEITWTDLIRGPVTFDGGHLGDPVLVREDGVFLYTLASVVDDIDFQITHIIRGEDHVTNTAVQIQLFEAITGATPGATTGATTGAKCAVEFAHFTLFTDKNGQGLSKRLGSLGLCSMRENGISAMAINSLLARLGTSLPIEPSLSLEQLATTFDFSIFSRTPPRFDPADLELLTHKIITLTPYDQIKEKLPVRITESIWHLIRGNLDAFDDVQTWDKIFSNTFQPARVEDEQDRAYLALALDHLPKATAENPWTTATWEQWTAALKEASGRKGRALFMPLRQALTGFDHGPEMKELLPYIGFEQALDRLKQATSS
jgi:glutamyl-tRNA synthetase